MPIDMKARALISFTDNIEKLRAIALHNIDLLLSFKDDYTNGCTNYCVMLPPIYAISKKWDSIYSGTKDRCIGYAEAYGYDTVVACGNLIVWPKERWGESLLEEVCNA